MKCKFCGTEMKDNYVYTEEDGAVWDGTYCPDCGYEVN